MDIGIPVKCGRILWDSQNHRYRVLYGGRGSSKSWSTARFLILEGVNRKLRILCAREIQNSIKDSVYRLLVDQIQELGLNNYYQIKADMIVGVNGTEFIFKGLQKNISEVKSTEGIDICFIAGTMVGERTIEKIQSGEIVYSYSHDTKQIELRRVLKTSRTRRDQPLYQLLTHAGGNGIIATGSHPIYVKGKGYRPINEVKKGDVVYAKAGSSGFGELFGRVRRSYQSGYQRATSKIQEAWRALLLRLCEKVEFGTNEKQKSNGRYGFTGKVKNVIEVKGGSTLDAWRKWTGIYESTANTIQGAWARMVERAGNYNGKEKAILQCSDKLQNRHSKCLLQIGDRNRWGIPSWPSKHGRGQEKGSVLKEYRVDSIKILQQSDIDRLGISDGGNYVYNLEVEVNNNYFANNLLVHNCWVEEAERVSENSWDNLIPTVRKEGSFFVIIFNPEDEKSATSTRFIEKDGKPINNPDIVKAFVNYWDNPFFPDVLRKEMEWDRKNDPDKFEHVWRGNPKKYGDAVIFKNKITVMDFETPPGEELYFGSDFGYANDPTVLVRMHIRDHKLWIDYEAYGVGVEIDELHQFFETVPDSHIWKIKADSARPETISHLSRPTRDGQHDGYMIEGAEKGKGSVEDGIQFLRSFEQIVIHPRCKGSIDNFRNYRWKADKITGEVLPIPVDKANHSPDACRYALESWIKSDYSLADVL